MTNIVINKTENESITALAYRLVEFSYAGIKKSYQTDAPRLIEFEILRDDLKRQISKAYSDDKVILRFYDETNKNWFIQCLFTYL